MTPYKLLNAEKKAAKSPNTFTLPDAEARASLGPGIYAKLGFDPCIENCPCERMWVLVLNKLEGQPYLYEGILKNNPEFIPPEILSCYDLVHFSPEHIFEILRP